MPEPKRDCAGPHVSHISVWRSGTATERNSQYRIGSYPPQPEEGPIYRDIRVELTGLPSASGGVGGSERERFIDGLMPWIGRIGG